MPSTYGYSTYGYVTSNSTSTTGVLYQPYYPTSSTSWQITTQITTQSHPQTYATCAETYANQIWNQWVLTCSPGNAIGVNWNPHHHRDEGRRAARTRARLLLGEFLDEEQKAELEVHGRFHVTGSKGRRYCIRAQGQAGNVDLLTANGEVQATLCAHPRDNLPEGDAWLMQMIELRHDEEHFLRTANVHRGRLPADVGRA
jgi:hypothetical protein